MKKNLPLPPESGVSYKSVMTFTHKSLPGVEVFLDVNAAESRGLCLDLSFTNAEEFTLGQFRDLGELIAYAVRKAAEASK